MTADVIEKIVSNSNNPVFQTAEFRAVLGDYRKYQCHTPNAGRINLDWEIEVLQKRLEL